MNFSAKIIWITDFPHTCNDKNLVSVGGTNTISSNLFQGKESNWEKCSFVNEIIQPVSRSSNKIKIIYLL